MSNKLVKFGNSGGQPSQLEIARQSQQFQAQYACIFALAVRYLREHGVVEMPVNEINMISSDTIMFNALDSAKNILEVNTSSDMPSFVRCEHISPAGADA